MSALPKSAIKFLELETIRLNKIGIPSSPAQATQDDTSALDKKSGILGMFRGKAKPTKAKVQPLHDIKPREYQIDVAGWLRFGLSDDSRMISLCICYADAKGEFVEIIEEQSVSDGNSAMLSGRVNIKARGPIKNMRVGCVGLKNDDRCYVEDITVSVPVAESKIA